MYNKLLKISGILVVLVLLICTYSWASPLTEDQKTYLKQWQDKPLTIGLDPFAGMEFFEDKGQYKGYMIDLAAYFSDQLGIEINLVVDKSWGQVYEALHAGDIDMLFGANPTPERLKVMSFTQEVYSVPYTVLVNKQGPIKTLGDLDGKSIGFIENDIVIHLFGGAYDRITYDMTIYQDQHQALQALEANEVEAFVTAGGEIVFDYILDHPSVRELVDLDDIRSELTLSTMKAQEALVPIFQSILDKHRQDIDAMIDTARSQYVRKIIDLTDQEREWLDQHPVIRVGVATDYLPVDHYQETAYKGIAGHYLSELAKMVGLKIEAVPATFDHAYGLMVTGQIDMLNMAKTVARKKDFIFTDAFSNERDQIYGGRDTVYVHDIYGLEGKRVAVVKGYWHEEYLNKNLRSYTLVKTKDIEESLALIQAGKADYMIETPMVAEYYINGLGYYDIVKRGETSSDSFLYFGLQKDMAPLASILNKAFKLVQYEESKYEGVKDLPQLDNIENKKLFSMLVFSTLVAVCLVIAIWLIVKRLVAQNLDMAVLKERNRLIYLDPLTGLYNRNHFNALVEERVKAPYCLALIVIDVNGLKETNDQFGHLIGDQLITKVAKIIEDVAQPALAIRMGGDEFVVWMPCESDQEPHAMIQKIRNLCHHITLENEEETLQSGVDVAIGYAMCNQESHSIDGCLHQADAAMYHDKVNLKQFKKTPERG